MGKKNQKPPAAMPVELPQESGAKIEKADDLFVALGNLSDKTIAHLRAVLERGDSQVMSNYEEMVEDYIQGFNHSVTQGVPPEWALFAFTQAYAITLGQCLRAGLPYAEAAKFLRTIIENADLSNKLVKQVTILTTGKTQQ